MTIFEKYKRNVIIKIFIVPLITAIISGILFIALLPEIKSALPNIQTYTQQELNNEADNL